MNPKRLSRRLLLLLLTVVAGWMTPAAHGQVVFTDDALPYNHADPIVGYWLGEATPKGQSVVISLNITRNDAGELRVQPNSLLMFGPGIPESPMILDGDACTFAIHVGGRTIDVRLHVDREAQRLTGTWTIDGDTDGPYDMTLQRSRKPLECAEPFAYTGEINVQDVMKLDMTIVVAETETGRWVGHVDVPAQGAMEYTLINLSQEDGLLRATMPGPVPALFALTFADDHARLTGTMTQGPMTLQMDFARNAEYVVAGLKRPQTPEPPFPYSIREVTVDHPDGHTLAGTLTIPAGEGPFPAVVFITGSGPQDRNESLMGHQPFLVIADYFSRHGIATLRCDDRGTADSTGTFAGATSLD
ncbi:MAG: hypothetical protein KC983_09820, partial [Phycisphaerales bacterium]|nr:hypothetical protein [Phycisphaerales bacterium]